MSQAKSQARPGVSEGLKHQLLSELLPEVSQAQAETWEILMDLEQIGTLLSSLADKQYGQLVSSCEAFSDL